MKQSISVFLLLLLLVLSSNVSAQQFEPEFVGEVNLLKSDSSVTLLDKENVQIKTKAGASLYMFGIGSVKSRITIKKPKASARVAKFEQFSLVVRAVDNNSDPISVVTLFKFEVKGKQRRAELSKSSTFGGTSSGNLEHVKYQAKKYGSSSYILTIPSIQAGEYGLIVHNPNNKDEKATIVACFGVD